MTQPPPTGLSQNSQSGLLYSYSDHSRTKYQPSRTSLPATEPGIIQGSPSQVCLPVSPVPSYRNHNKGSCPHSHLLLPPPAWPWCFPGWPCVAGHASCWNMGVQKTSFNDSNSPVWMPQHTWWKRFLGTLRKTRNLKGTGWEGVIGVGDSIKQLIRERLKWGRTVRLTRYETKNGNLKGRYLNLA